MASMHTIPKPDSSGKPQPRTTREQTLFQARVDRDRFNRFRAAAGARGMSAAQLFRVLMDQLLKSEDKKVRRAS